MKTALSAVFARVFLWVLASASALAVSPAPEVSLSLRGVRNHTVEVGEPLFLAVRIDVRADSDAAIELNPASGTWADAVAVDIIRVDGAASDVPARPASPPESASATLDAERNVGGVWVVASSASGPLAPGNYVARARLAISGSTGWNGESMSEDVALRVVAASNAPERVRQRAMARAHEAVVVNAPDEAARLLDAQLTSNPDDIAILTLRAALCVRGGDYRSALVCVNRAIRCVEQSRVAHPPGDLFALESQIALALQSPSTTVVAPPAWTRLPASVVAPWQEKPVAATVAPTTAVAKPMATVDSPTPQRPTTRPSSLAPAPAPSPSQAGKASTVAAIGPAAIGMVVPAGELTDARVRADASGQWAATAIAGSQYGRTQYAAAQATGAPNIATAGNSPDAWCPARKNEGTEWLEVSFAKPVHGTEVRIRQNDTPGCIVKVEAIEPDGAAHVWWEGVDPYVVPPTREIVWFGVRVPPPTYRVAKIKITLNLTAASGWKEIDAVQLVGEP